MHEPVAGQIDLTGRTAPNLDLGSFIDLCRDNGLAFFVRPGPFIMAEMKNEGLPVLALPQAPGDRAGDVERPAGAVAHGGLPRAGVPGGTRRWYDALGKVIAPRLQPRGGNIVAMQLDNEIGMLSWISSAPDLTEQVLADFIGWLREVYDAETLAARYRFDLDDPRPRAEAIRAPHDEYADALLRDLGHYMRQRYARYVAALRNYARTRHSGRAVRGQRARHRPGARPDVSGGHQPAVQGLHAGAGLPGGIGSLPGRPDHGQLPRIST